MSTAKGYHHLFHFDTLRGFNRTTPEHRSFLIEALRAIQLEEGGGHRKEDYRIAPSIVAYCDSMLAPYLSAYKRSQRTWGGLRAFEADEGDHRRPYVAGFGVETWKKQMTRAWNAA